MTSHRRRVVIGSVSLAGGVDAEEYGAARNQPALDGIGVDIAVVRARNREEEAAALLTS